MLKHIEDLMADEEYEKALDVLNHALRLDVYEPRVYQRYAFVLRMVGNAQAAELFEKVVYNPNDAEAYYKVAQSLFKSQQFAAAINPLRKVVELIPMATNAIFELGFAYLKEHDFEKARAQFSEAHELQPAINTAFYISYCSLMQRDVEGAKALIPYMEEEYFKILEEPYLAHVLQEMIARYEAFPPQDLRGWHFVQYGQPLLRTSWEDIGQNPEELNGRYVFINYGWLNIALVLETMKRLIEEIPGYPKFEYIMPVSPRVAPIAFAFSELTGIPMAQKEVLESDMHGLVFLSWSDEVERTAQHLVKNPNITTFAFSMGWTLQAPLAPEFIGYLDQASRLPWEATVEVHENGERRPRPAMTAPVEVIGYHILDRHEKMDDEDRASIEKVVAYYKERAGLLKIGENANWPRLGFQIESPVQSIRMMI